MGAREFTLAMEVATIKLSREAYLGAILPQYTEEEFIQKIDEIYGDEKNRLIPVAFVAYVIKDLFMGEISEKELDNQIKELRQVAIEMQKKSNTSVK